MFKLFIAVNFLYFLPSEIWLPNGVSFFVYSTTLSLIFIAYLSTLKSHVAGALIAIETFSILLNFIGSICYLWSFKSAYIYEHRPTIMTACFITELVIIFGARLRYVGANEFVYALRFHFHNIRAANNGLIRSMCSHSEAVRCKT